MNKDITFCANNEDCPLRSKCQRVNRLPEGGIVSMCNFFDETASECEYFYPIEKSEGN